MRNSRPRSAISCAPTQMPRNGRPLRRTLVSSASRMPGTASSPPCSRRTRRRPAARCGRPPRRRAGSALTSMRDIGLALARRALERLGRRVQVARAVVDDDEALHGDGSGARSQQRADDGRRGSTSPAAAAAGCGAMIGWVGSQASKKRRSHSAAFRPETEPSMRQPRRSSAQRRSVSASKPISRLRARPASVIQRGSTMALQPHALEDAAQHDVAQQRPPQPVGEQPDRREQRRDPGEAVLDEDEAFRPVDAVGRRIGRLVHGEREHGCRSDCWQCPF